MSSPTFPSLSLAQYKNFINHPAFSESLKKEGLVSDDRTWWGGGGNVVEYPFLKFSNGDQSRWTALQIINAVRPEFRPEKKLIFFVFSELKLAFQYQFTCTYFMYMKIVMGT